MSKKAQNKSALESVYEIAKGMHESGVIDTKTMHKYDALCLPTIVDFSPGQIKKLRLREKVSQAVFAKFLNTSVSTVQQWEQGLKHPRGTSLKLLNLVLEKGLDGIT